MNIKNNSKLKFILINMVVALVIILVIGFYVLSRLDNYTRHQHTISVPAFYGLSESDARSLAEQKKLRVTIVDSIYDASAKPGIIIDQYPVIGARVKDDRMIRLTINARNPEKVIFPDLQNSSFRQALQTLESKGFKIGSIIYVPSDFKNLVLGFRYRNQAITPGSKFNKGSVIDIELGNDGSGNIVYIPKLTGKRTQEAVSIAQHTYLNVNIIPDKTIKTKADELSAIVYQQSPAYAEQSGIEAGSVITLYITQDEKRLAKPDPLPVE